MLTSVGTAVVPATSATIGKLEREILDLDPDVAALITEVDAILCAAPTPAHRLPGPPVPGSDFSSPIDWTVPQVRRSAPRRAPVQPVQAVQRSPPL